MKSVLILSGENETHAEAVAGKILNDGGDVFCFRVDKYPFEYYVDFDGKHSVLGKFNGPKITLDDNWSIWNKRRIAPTFPANFQDKFKNNIKYECEKTLDGVLLNHRGLVINKPVADYYAANKIHQLYLAQQFDITIPASIISNNPNTAKEFRSKFKSIAFKQQRAPLYENKAMFTKIITDDMDVDYGKVRSCPITFQNAIEKDYELRIITIGDSIFAFGIDASNTHGETDWRRGNYLDYKHFSTDIPSDLKSKLLNMTSHYELHYAAFDFIKTPQDDYVFLELNPRGQFLWLEHLTNVNLTECLVDYLTN